MNENPLVHIDNLNVEFPLFGGILQREVASVHAVKNFSLDIQEGKTKEGRWLNNIMYI